MFTVELYGLKPRPSFQGSAENASVCWCQPVLERLFGCPWALNDTIKIHHQNYCYFLFRSSNGKSFETARDSSSIVSQVPSLYVLYKSRIHKLLILLQNQLAKFLSNESVFSRIHFGLMMMSEVQVCFTNEFNERIIVRCERIGICQKMIHRALE